MLEGYFNRPANGIRLKMWLDLDFPISSHVFMQSYFFTMGTKHSRRLIAIVLAMTIALQPGCINVPAQPAKAQVLEETEAYKDYDTKTQAGLGNVAVVATAQMPKIAFWGFARSKGDAAGKTAGNTFEDCIGGLKGGCSGEFCGLVIVFWIATCGVVVTPIAAIVGAAKAPSSEEIGKSENTMSQTLDAQLIQGQLRDQVVADANASGVKTVVVPTDAIQTTAQWPDYTLLAAKGVDTVLEVALTQVFSENKNKGINPQLPLSMQAHIRLIRTKDNSVVLTDNFFFHGKQFSYTEWTANNAEKLAQALNTGYATIAQEISDRVFLLYPFPDGEPQAETGACGLGPVEPGNGDVAGLQPTISWQSFPRTSDIAAAPQEMARIANVRYDLIVGIGENGESPEVIYRRDALPGTTHKIDIVLKPHARYFWSTRARFELDGRQHVTKWGMLCPFSQLVVGARLYRFYTRKHAPEPAPEQ